MTEVQAPSTVRFDVPAPGVGRITLARPEARNAQSFQLLYQLNDAFNAAMRDPAVKVVILAGDGPHFSAGHDLKEGGPTSLKLLDEAPVGSGAGLDASGIAGIYAREDEAYLGLCERWRRLPKPTIAQVHGKVIAAGLMLAWSCDLIVASDDAVFQDPVVGLGVSGVELFSHPWELGARKAKEFLMTADAWTAEEGHRLGMVNHVVPRADLEAFTVDLAKRIANKPAFALSLVKEAVNNTLDEQGMSRSLRSAFHLHQLSQAQAVVVDGLGDLSGLPPELQGHWKSVQERVAGA